MFIFKENVNGRVTRVGIPLGNKRRVWRIYASLRDEIENRTAHKDGHGSRPLGYVKTEDIESGEDLSIASKIPRYRFLRESREIMIYKIRSKYPDYRYNLDFVYLRIIKDSENYYSKEKWNKKMRFAERKRRETFSKRIYRKFCI